MALGAVMDEASDHAVRASLAAFDATLRPYRAGDYPNFVEAPSDASRYFGAGDWARLRAIKHRYDPTDVFAGNFQIKPA